MATQWLVGMGGVIGLNYGSIPTVLRMQGIARGQWADIFESIRIMEAEALNIMRKE